MHGARGKRERTLYEIASSTFAAVVICFAVAGMLATGLGDEGPGSAGFVICTVFLLLGLGRLYLGLWRGEEGSEPPPPAAEPKPRRQGTGRARGRRPGRISRR